MYSFRSPKITIKINFPPEIILNVKIETFKSTVKKTKTKTCIIKKQIYLLLRTVFKNTFLINKMIILNNNCYLFHDQDIIFNLILF